MTFSVKSGSFRYKRCDYILKDISFEVQPGELLAILGPNGIGKTTLLKCMMGFQKWDGGATLLDDKNIASLPEKEIWKTMAYIPQVKDYSYGFTGLDMAVIGRSAHLGTFRQPKPEDVAIASEAMERIGITHLADKPCNQMSGGEFQMVLIARALATQPKILILDEPETGLDFHNQLIILELLDSLVHKQGLAVIMNTHYPMHAMKIADKTLMLGSECTYFFGPTKEVVTADNMRSTFRIEVAFADVEVEGRMFEDVIPVSMSCGCPKPNP